MPPSSTPSKLASAERQVLDVAFEELDAGIFPPGELDELRADVEPGADASMLAQEGAEHAGAAAEIGHPGAGGNWPSRTTDWIRRALLSGANTS